MKKPKITEILKQIDTTLADLDNKPYQGYYRWLEEFVGIVYPKTVVELGTFEGGSTLYILKSLPEDSKLISIDTENRFTSYDPRLTLVIGDDLSNEVWEQVPNNIDILFIDTNHTFEHFTKEITKYQEKFASTCYVVLDDINLPDMAGVWDSITVPKYDISQYHGSGFGLAVYT